MNGPGRLHRVHVDLPEGPALAMAERLEEAGFHACSAFEEGPLWRVEALCDGRPDGAALDRFAAAAAAAGAPGVVPVVAEVPDIDWLAENRRQFPPVSVGRFHVVSTLDAPPTPAGRVRVVLDAGLAFGTGRHATTALCLGALDAVLRRGPARHILDLGCGSGLLAIAAARAAPGAAIDAVDVDPVAVDVAVENARRNGVGSRVRAATGDRPPAGQRYDLVLANILAGPLMGLAEAVADALRPGGRAVLSGLLVGQERRLVARYRAAGLFFVARRREAGWSALTFRRASK